MSGIVSGITKVFSAVGSAASRVGTAIMGVGATTFTAGAAAGAAPLAQGGLAGIVQKFVGGGTLGNILTGAITQAGYGALVGGAVSALTGGSFGKGALMGGLGGAVTGGLMGYAGLNPDPLTKGFAKPPGSNPGVDTGIVTGSTPTGGVPTGAATPAPSSPDAVAPLTQAQFDARSSGTAAGGAVAAPAAQGGGFSQFLSSPLAGGLVQGLGQGLAGYMQAKDKKEEAEAERQFLIDKEQRLRDSYSVGPAALHGPVAADTGRPTPATKYSRSRFQYDPAIGRIVSTPA